MSNDLSQAPVVAPTALEFWTHCATTWGHVADGAYEGGNLPQELFFDDLAQSAMYVVCLLGSAG